jgi:hypothetical protein
MWRREGSGGRDNRCCRIGGCIVVAIKGGGRRREVTSLSSSHKDTMWGRDVGGGTTMTVVEGEAVSSLLALLSGVGKNPGERVAGGRQLQ